MDVNTSDKKELRKFGLVMAVAILVLALIRWALHGFHAWPWYFTYVAIAFGVLGLAAPRLLQPVFWGWMNLVAGALLGRACHWETWHASSWVAFCAGGLVLSVYLAAFWSNPDARLPWHKD